MNRPKGLTTLSDADVALERLEQMSDKLSSKDSLYLTFTNNNTEFTVKFKNPIKLKQDKSYECGLQFLATSNFQANITNENNQFIYSADNGATWITLTLDPGAYEFDVLQNEIKRLMIERKHVDSKNEPYMQFGIIKQTFKSFINITNPTYKVDFTKPNTFRVELGFESRILSNGYNVSDNTVQITTSSMINLHCDLISGSYHNGEMTDVLYSFPAYLVPSGYKLNLMCNPIIYLPVLKSVINSVSFRLSDENEKTLDFRNEEISLAIHLKQV